MKCKFCDYPKAYYLVKKLDKKKSRTDFKVRCPKCKKEYNDQPTALLTPEISEIPKKKVSTYYIKCELTNQKMIKDAGTGCQQFLPIDVSEKRRCVNCVYAKPYEEIEK